MNSNHLPERSFAAQKQWSDCLPAPSTNSITKILCRGSVPASRVWLPFPSSLSCSQSADSEGADSFRKWHEIKDQHHYSNWPQTPQLVLKKNWSRVSQTVFSLFIFSRAFMLAFERTVQWYLFQEFQMELVTLNSSGWFYPQTFPSCGTK